MGILAEFKEFAVRGNVVDLAVGVIMGAAFGPIVTSLVNDVIMPPIGWAIGRIDFSKLAVDIPVPVGDPVKISYGKFLNATLTFVVTAVAVFMLVKFMNAIHKKKDEAPKFTKSEELLTEIRDALKKPAA
jgi:large conductance mechanosensitive channel